MIQELWWGWDLGSCEDFQYLLTEQNLYRNYLRVILQILLGEYMILELSCFIFVLLLVTLGWPSIPLLWSLQLWLTPHWILPNLLSLFGSDRLPSILWCYNHLWMGRNNVPMDLFTWVSFLFRFIFETEGTERLQSFSTNTSMTSPSEEDFLVVTAVCLK